MDCVSKGTDTDQSQCIVTSARKSSASPVHDSNAPQEGSADPHTNNCSFCSDLIHSNSKSRSTTTVQRLVFHEECQSCSSPHGAQVSLCGFCKHLRLRHLVQCARSVSISIDLDPIARALRRTECDLCDFLTKATSLPQMGPSEVEIIPATSATLVIHFFQDPVIKGRRGSPMRDFSVNLKAEYSQAPTTDWVNSEDFVQWDVIRQWLSYCNDKHEHQYTPRSTFPPGFRVIDVDKRCVVERQDLCDFVALSYVWGSRSESACYVEQATRDNIKSLSVPGGLTQLPETIEDAIVVCQKLGIKYLWVDRYCIVQDHAIHKHTQVAAMADIYSSSTITIIACSGKDGVESGIPGVRRERQKRRRINIQGLALSYSSPDLDDIIPRSIWNTRGWTYQEAVLSKRKLIMAPTEVWLQCADDSFREYDSRYVHETDWNARIRVEPDPDFDYTVFVDYATNLRMYTRRKLGYASDIYNAFDGIAQALYARDDGFHFGLPEPHFDRALLWYCGCRWNDSRSRCLRVCAETTPSWSWGSITCGVVHDSLFCMTLVRWVLYKIQLSDMHSQSANPETYRAHGIELKATDEPDSWKLWSLGEGKACPQLFLALAINEGCITAGEAFVPEHENFPSLKEHFTRRWPTYTEAYKEIWRVDTSQSSGPNGVIFTKAQSAIFNIRSGWIQNANGMVIGGIHRAKLPKISDDDRWQVYEDHSNSREHCDCEDHSNSGEEGDYEECSNYEECREDEECCIEGVALSISEARIYNVLKLNNPGISLESYWWEGQQRELARDLTYFDHKGEALYPVPKVNVMFISREDGYARRIGLGWIVLKQWSSFDWTLKDIWLK